MRCSPALILMIAALSASCSLPGAATKEKCDAAKARAHDGWAAEAEFLATNLNQAKAERDRMAEQLRKQGWGAPADLPGKIHDYETVRIPDYEHRGEAARKARDLAFGDPLPAHDAARDAWGSAPGAAGQATAWAASEESYLVCTHSGSAEERACGLARFPAFRAWTAVSDLAKEKANAPGADAHWVRVAQLAFLARQIFLGDPGVWVEAVADPQAQKLLDDARGLDPAIADALATSDAAVAACPAAKVDLSTFLSIPQ